MIKTLKTNLIRTSVRSFSISNILLTEGAINQGHRKFSEKERAQENVYYKAQEAAQIKQLRKKLDKQRETIDKLQDEIDNLKKD